jgi:hypothetical protein
VWKGKVRQADNLYLCQYSPVKTLLEEPRSCVAGAAEWPLILTIRRRGKESSSRVQPISGSNTPGLSLVWRFLNVEMLWRRGQIREQEPASEKCDSTSRRRPLAVAEDIMLIFLN